MAVQTYVAFILKCLDCGLEVEVGPTHKFVGADSGEPRRAYFHPQANEGDNAVGISSGTGSTFRCIQCHALRWAEAKKARGGERE